VNTSHHQDAQHPGGARADALTGERWFQRQRQALLNELGDPRRGCEARRRLDALYLTHRAKDVRGRARGGGPQREENVDAICVLVEAALEDGLIRLTRREQIIEEGRRRGLSDFHTQLLIAQVQFGEALFGPAGEPARAAGSQSDRIGARLAAAGVLGFALFLAAVRWLNV
jgi:hypothetical protein